MSWYRNARVRLGQSQTGNIQAIARLPLFTRSYTLMCLAHRPQHLKYCGLGFSLLFRVGSHAYWRLSANDPANDSRLYFWFDWDTVPLSVQVDDLARVQVGLGISLDLEYFSSSITSLAYFLSRHQRRTSLFSAPCRASTMTIDPSAGCNWDLKDWSLCTLETCCLDQGAVFTYIPNYGGNIFFAVFFGAFIIPNIYLGVRYKTWGYMAGMIIGLILEILGYASRIMIHDNPWDGNAFLL